MELIINLLRIIELFEFQFGFREGCSTLDFIFLLREAILEAKYLQKGKLRGLNQKLYAAFLDFQGAFDGVPQ